MVALRCEGGGRQGVLGAKKNRAGKEAGPAIRHASLLIPLLLLLLLLLRCMMRQRRWVAQLIVEVGARLHSDLAGRRPPCWRHCNHCVAAAAAAALCRELRRGRREV